MRRGLYRHGRSAGGERPLYELPLDYVATLDEILADVIIPEVGLSSVKLAWGAGDGNRPRIWLGARLKPSDPNPLSVTGAPVPGHTPWQGRDGEAVASEEHSGATYRVHTATSLDPASGEDTVVGALIRTPLDCSTTDVALSTLISRGWHLFANVTSYVLWVVGDSTQSSTLPVTFGGLAFLLGVIDRDTDLCLWLNGDPDASPAVVPAGALGAASGIGLAARPNGANPFSGGIISAFVVNAAGAADPFKADSGALIKRLTRMLTGIEPKSGLGLGAPTFARASASCGADRNGRHFFFSAGMPRAGDSEGYAFDDAVTNYTFRNVDITATAGWSWSAGLSVTANIDDSTAQEAGAEGDVSAWGRVLEAANSTGSDGYLYSDGPIGVTTACHLLALARIVAGSGARLGWYEPGGPTWTDVGALADSYTLTRLQNTSPPNANCRLAILVPDGCTVRAVAGHSGRGANAPAWPVPNYATAAAAVGAMDALQAPEAVVSDGAGAIEAEVAPLTDPGANANIVVARRATSGTVPLYLARTTAGQQVASSNDGTSVVATSARAAAVGAHELHRASWSGAVRTVRDPDEVAAGAFDLAWGGGALELGQGGLPHRTRHARFFGRSKP